MTVLLLLVLDRLLTTSQAFQLAEVFEKFGAELGPEECMALLAAIDVTDQTAPLTFDDFLRCMAVLVNA